MLLEMVNLNNIFDEDTDKDNLLIIIDYGKQKTKFFLKGNISSKKIIKSEKNLLKTPKR